MIKTIFLLLVLTLNVIAYEFILLNNTTIDDEELIEAIQNQVKHYYYTEENDINFYELNNKEKILAIINNFDYSGNKGEQKSIIAKHEDLEDDLEKIFNTEYFLIVNEQIDRDGRDELSVVIKVKNVNYFDSSFIMPKLDEKNEHYINTIANIVLTYIAYKDKNFIKVNQL